MFAGGEYEFYNPLKVGSEVKIICKINEIFKKKGKTGELIFVKIRKDFFINDLKCARETRSLVFSDCTPNSQPEGIVGKTGEWIEQLNSNPIQLFKFSALTFNGHRIHYDRKYAIENEGYPSLVVHGPLIASLLSFFAEKKTGRKLSKFNFKGIRPIFEINKFFLTGEKIENNSSNLKVLDHEFKIAVEARCEFF